MDKQVRKNLEAAGYRFMDAEDFLELSEEDRQIVELRMELRRNIREKRRQSKLTQHELAKKIKSSQSRVAKIESGAPDVSLDLMFRSFFAAGCKLSDLGHASAAFDAKVKRAPTKMLRAAAADQRTNVKKRLTKD
jgi:transcriptional regulator with XRE-family HTH domain